MAAAIQSGVATRGGRMIDLLRKRLQPYSAANAAQEEQALKDTDSTDFTEQQQPASQSSETGCIVQPNP